MGRSQTIHCIGVGKTHGYVAMNRVEMAQEEHKAATRDGDTIEYWYPQTRTGERVIATPAPKLVTCPICKGDGHNGRYFCPVCNGSGICRPGNQRHWRQWQLDEMKAHREGGSNHGTG